jgi:phenylacetate-CoA ligase
MMKSNIIAKYFGYPLQDFIKKTEIFPVLDLMKESQNWEYNKMAEYRLIKLKELVKHAYNNVPYYKQLFDNHSISPHDINTLDDLKKIPILTKDIARANQDQLISKNHNRRNIKTGKTGGTTGVPLIFLSDTQNRSYSWASYYRWLDWIGLRKEGKTLVLWGAKAVIKPRKIDLLKEKIIDWIRNDKTINTFSINNESIPNIYKEIIHFNPVFIKGYLSAIILLAKYMKENNLPANKNLKAISSTTETLLPVYRALITNTFHVPIFDQYGCGEIPAISYECTGHEGLHITEEHVIVEVIDDNDNHLIDKSGRLILTNLDNFIMPFIRYENGDSASLLSKKCSCGISSQLMTGLDGRTIDMVYLDNGSKVHGVFFTDILYELGITTDDINRFQIIQTKIGEIDFIIESIKPVSVGILDKILTETQKHIRLVNLKVVDHIPSEKTGKFKYIKNEIPLYL